MADRRTALALLLSATLAAFPQAAGAGAPAVVTRAPLRAFGSAGEIVVRGLPADAAGTALAAAAAAIAEIERLTDAAQPTSGLARLNAAAGKGPQAVDRQLEDELARAWGYCLWSDRRHGPLGGALYDLWRNSAPPTAQQLDDAAGLTNCDRLTIDAVHHKVTLTAGSRLDLTGFAAGLAVDRAIDALREHGAGNALVHIGQLWRALGDGADGRGWWVTLPTVPGSEAPAERIRLRDQAVMILGRDDPALAPGSAVPHYLDERSGQTATGNLEVASVTALAADALPLTVAVAIAGAHQGELLLGSVDPPPSVMWLEGSGTGEPLLVEHHWAAVTKH